MDNTEEEIVDIKKQIELLKDKLPKKQTLVLKPSDTEGLYEGIRSNGVKYTVRGDRRRYFFPGEWRKFDSIEVLDNAIHRLFFHLCLFTGGRAMEVLHLKPSNFDFERGAVTFDVTKQRKAKKQFYSIGKTRMFLISSNCLKEVKSYIIKHKIEPNKYLFLDNESLPANYSSLTNSEKKKYYKKTEIAYSNLFKRKLRKAGIEDWRNFSLHNIRKTYGNWMRLFNIKTEEICYRLGHDLETYQTHYGSALIFTDKERMEIMKIMGEVK